MDVGDGGGVAGGVEGRLPAGVGNGAADLGPRRLDLARSLEHAEPGEGRPVGIGGSHGEAEGGRRLVAQEARDPAPRGQGGVRLPEDRRDGGGVPRLEHLEGRLEEQEARAVLRESEGRRRWGLGAHGLRAS